MTSVTTVNLIYLGNYADVDLNECDYNAEMAGKLVGVSKGADDLSLVKATLTDPQHDGVISDNERSSDTVTYNAGKGTVKNQTDSTMSVKLNVTLSDGSVKQIEAVMIQQTNGDLFVTDLLNKGTLDNLSIAKIEVAQITGANYSGWYSNQSVDNTTFVNVVTLDGTVEGTSGNDVIDSSYKGDPEGDRIDNNDAIASGAQPNDDLVYGYGGNDSIASGAGDDVVYGGSGNDKIDGGTGNDTLHGDDGCDIIEGGEGNDTIYGGADADAVYGGKGNDAVYGDAGNDFVYGGDGDDKVYGGAGADKVYGGAGNDSAYGGDGDDKIEGGAGNDYIEGGAGDDSVNGGAGNDVIYGDSANGASGPTYVRESFEWSKAPDPSGNGTSIDDGDNLKGGFSQNTGNVTVTFSQSGTNEHPATTFETEAENVSGINSGSETVNTHSSLDSVLDKDGETVTYNLGFSEDVQNISFRINDIDYASKVQVYAYDMDGNRVAVDISAGSKITVQDNDGVGGTETLLASGGGGSTETDGNYSALVNIAGPISRIEIVHTKVQSLSPGNNAGVNVTDVFFDAPVEGSVVTGGNDILNGGTGDDIIYGEGGNDTLYGDAGNDVLYGGAGADKVFGGDDRDTIYGGAGDSVDGGAGGDDYDVLVLNDGEIYITTGPDGTGAPVLDADGNSFSGRVVFTDANGVPTGEYIDYTEIEEIRGGNPLRDGTVFGTEGNDTMGVGYADPTDGDLIDGDDAILAGDTGNDDLIYGLGGNDTINAGEGNDEVYGGTGNDSITGGNGDDTVSGDDGNDIVRGGNGNDTVFGGAGDDTGFGGDGDDLVYGGAGNDQLNGNAGNDTIYGGIGNDTVSGQTGDDVLYGDAGNDIINGDAGNDVAYGGEGDDYIDTSNHVDPGFDNPYPGLPGDANTQNDLDTVYGGAGNDTIITGDDADVIFGGTGNDKIDAGIDNDYVEGGEGDDTIIGGEGVDTIYGDAGDDLIYGGLANDTLDVVDFDADGNPVDLLPGNNMDTIYGGDGNDTIYGRDDDDTIYGGSGNDLVYGGIDDDVIFGGEGDDVLYGDQGNDTIAGNQGNDTIYGGEGDDTLTGSKDDDLVYGGTGNDFIQGGSGFDTLYGDDGDDRIQGGDDDDSIFGGTGNDSIQGGGGNDYIDGGDGDDLIGGADGKDTILGGAGNDVIRAAGGDDSIFGGEGDDLIYGGDGNDNIAGNQGDDTIYGGAGDDTLTGSKDNDLVYGGTGNDFIQGGSGFDTLYGDDGDDRIQGGDDDDSIFGGAGNDSIQGGGGNDYIDGGDGDDLIGGADGDDTILGGAGNDTILGAGGADVIYGGAGDDVINTDQGNASLPDRDYPGDGLAADADPFDNRDTVYGGAGNDTIKTGDDADLIYGGDGIDNIDAGVDNDTIYSGDGADVVKGGLGSDRFMDASSGDVIIGGEDPDGSDVDTFNFDQETLDKIDRIVRNGGAGDSEELRESGIIYFKDGTTATFSQIEAPCFTPGTTIATPKGERLVEDLRAGDKVITRDNGIQEIAWVGAKEMTGKELAAKPHMKPILVKAGSLGHGLPERDMLLSPNHRVLVASEKTQLYFEEREVLAAAKHMTGAQGIHTLDVMRTTYIHFMFERHEVVLSNGAWTESFHPGDYSLNGLGNSQRNEIFELFPDLATTAGIEGYQAARKSLKKHEARLLMK
ncbi:Hint domain-containing protein [Loktanella sp. R86503]|uniref:Hint domain-containing protein n=1 Tax=Loktanella sp. R86503 TaxID=3093847 RepID=UPI0036DEC4AE